MSMTKQGWIKRKANGNGTAWNKGKKFPELRFEPSNGRTLCVPCHKKTGTFGRGAIYRTKSCVASA